MKGQGRFITHSVEHINEVCKLNLLVLTGPRLLSSSGQIRTFTRLKEYSFEVFLPSYESVVEFLLLSMTGKFTMTMMMVSKRTWTTRTSWLRGGVRTSLAQPAESEGGARRPGQTPNSRLDSLLTGVSYSFLARFYCWSI